MPMYNLIEYNKNYLKATGNLWNYYRDEPNSGSEEDIPLRKQNLLIIKLVLQENEKITM